ncbi:hypothetical protein ACJJTC_006535 [Scirpophaga incertulas]
MLKVSEECLEARRLVPRWLSAFIWNLFHNGASQSITCTGVCFSGGIGIGTGTSIGNGIGIGTGIGTGFGTGTVMGTGIGSGTGTGIGFGTDIGTSITTNTEKERKNKYIYFGLQK